ncbi:MAG TPA: cytochrome P460 family protein [Pyrinomonadaceae bacterium]|jgi:hypothetical protein
MLKKVFGGGLVLFAVLGFGALYLLSSGASEGSAAFARGGVETVAELKEVRQYRKWTRVHTTPLPLSTTLDGLCRAPTQVNLIETSSNPHRQNYFSVYVNEAGSQAMLSQSKPVFPPGSIIVKEKLPAKDSTRALMLTVMIKHDKGFNPATGDWEYAVTNGEGSEIEWRGTRANCHACHALKNETDYVFRSYLSDEAKQKLH